MKPTSIPIPIASAPPSVGIEPIRSESSESTPMVGELYLGKQVPDDGDPWAILTDAVQDKSPLVRTYALLALQYFRNDRAASLVKIYAASLSDTAEAFPGSLPVGWSAAGCLNVMGGKAELAVPDLIKAAEGKNLKIRCKALEALGAIGREAPSVVPELLPILRGALKVKAESNVRTAAAHALDRIGPAAAKAVPDLISLLADERDQAVRSPSLLALGSIGPASSPAVPTLVKVLEQSKDEDERRDAIRALGAIGAEAQPAVQILERLTKDSRLGDAATDALKAIQG